MGLELLLVHRQGLKSHTRATWGFLQEADWCDLGVGSLQRGGVDTTRAEKRSREDMVERVAISKPTGASDEARPADSLISDSWPPECEKVYAV